MADRLSRERRSWNMSHIRSKDTGIEVKVRKFLFSKGYRYRKNDSKLPGKPDIVLSKYKTVIFVHGCYWHRHPGVKIARRLPPTQISGFRSSTKMFKTISCTSSSWKNPAGMLLLCGNARLSIISKKQWIPFCKI